MQELCEVICIRRSQQRIRGAADAEPGEWRQRCIRLHAPPQRRKRIDEAGNAYRGHHGGTPTPTLPRVAGEGVLALTSLSRVAGEGRGGGAA